MRKLLSDESRCEGYTKMPTFYFEQPDTKQKCTKADTCERYLQRKSIGPRTNVMLAESTKGCDLYIKR